MQQAILRYLFLDFWQALVHQSAVTQNSDIIQHLNAVLKNKLTGINQYFLHARILKHQGNLKLADHEYKASIDAMKHSDMLVEHILSLGGLPNLQHLGDLMIGETYDAMLKSDRALNNAAHEQIEATIALAQKLGQTATVGLLGRMLESQKERAEFIRTQLANSNIKDCA